MKAPTNFHTICSRGALVLLLAALLAIPLTACQSSAPSQSSISSTAQSGIAGSDDRWANFDDGSDVLSLSVPYSAGTLPSTYAVTR